LRRALQSDGKGDLDIIGAYLLVGEEGEDDEDEGEDEEEEEEEEEEEIVLELTLERSTRR